MKRVLGVAVALGVTVLSLSASDAGKRKKAKGPSIPAAGWDAMVKSGHRSVLYRTNYEGVTETLTLVTTGVKKSGDVTTACIQNGEDCVYEVAVGPKGVWFGVGGLGEGALKGEPTFTFGQPGWKQGDDFVRYAGGEVCVGWENTQYECDDVCYWTVCMAPDAGITSVDGTASPDMGEWEADSAACMAPETYLDGLAAADGAVTACAENECRSVDVKTGDWKKVSKPAGVQPVSPRATSAKNADGTITAEAKFDEASGRTTLVTTDAAGKVLASKKLDEETGIGDILFVEGFLVVESYACAGPCQQWDLYEPTKLKSKGTVGGKDPVIAGTRPILISGTTYAFVDAFAEQVVLVDMKKGKQKKKLKLKKLAIDPGVGSVSAIGVAGGVALVYSPLSQIVMVTGKGKLGKTWYGPGTCHASK